MKHYPEGAYRCTTGFTHGNIGLVYHKDKTYNLAYEVPKALDCDYVLLGNKRQFRISPEFFENHFDWEHPVSVKVYKLVRLGKDGQCYPLFIGKDEPFQFGTVMHCQYLPTKGFAPRSVDDSQTGGWHCCFTPVAPHLSEKLASGCERVWIECEGSGKIKTYHRGLHQGGDWILVENLKPVRVMPWDEVRTLQEQFNKEHGI